MGVFFVYVFYCHLGCLEKISETWGRRASLVTVSLEAEPDMGILDKRGTEGVMSEELCRGTGKDK